MVAIGCNWRPFFKAKNAANLFVFNKLSVDDVSPEKAGVGGSIPSLATTSSIRTELLRLVAKFGCTSPSIATNFSLCLGWLHVISRRG